MDIFFQNTSPLGNGVHVPVHPFRRSLEESKWDEIDQVIERNENLVNDFKRRRASFRKRAGFAGGDVLAAIPRFYDPADFWDQQNLPWDVTKLDHRRRLYKWLDLFYRTHHLIPLLVDIFTRFPLVGMELKCKDKELAKFYEDVFFDRLDYQEFFVSLGREYWTFGQAFPLGSFDENLGIWEREELIDPLLVEIKHFPIIGNSQFYIHPPSELTDIARNKTPVEQYWQLKREYPGLLPYLENDKPIPVSNVLLKQVAFKVSPRDTHGTPILLRALRTLIHEEKLLASQDAIAERLYSPLILAKLGVADLGDGLPPWIPTPDEMGAFRDDLDIALASDFRLLVHHFGVEIQNVFGREQMPRLGEDFDRVSQRIMQVFGVNPSLLSGGAASQPYASSALQAEFLNQILRTYQQYLKKHFRERALIVAEAQEHYDYEKRGNTRIPIMEEVVEVDEDGNKSIVEKNKLLVPELEMKVLDLRDEQTQRQYLMELRAQGIPIPDQDLAIGFKYDFRSSLETYQDELIAKTVAQQQAKVKTYRILLANGLPIPPELKAEVEGMLEETGSEFELGEPTELGGLPHSFGPSGPPPDLNLPDLGGPGITPPIGPNDSMRGIVPEQSTERQGIPPLENTGVPTSPNSPGKLTHVHDDYQVVRNVDGSIVKLVKRQPVGRKVTNATWLEIDQGGLDESRSIDEEKDL